MRLENVRFDSERVLVVPWMVDVDPKLKLLVERDTMSANEEDDPPNTKLLLDVDSVDRFAVLLLANAMADDDAS